MPIKLDKTDKVDGSTSSDTPGHDIKNLIDRAVRVALEAFRDKFGKLLRDRLDAMDDRVNQLESKNQALRVAIIRVAILTW